MTRWSPSRRGRRARRWRRPHRSRGRRYALCGPRRGPPGRRRGAAWPISRPMAPVPTISAARAGDGAGLPVPPRPVPAAGRGCSCRSLAWASTEASTNSAIGRSKTPRALVTITLGLDAARRRGACRPRPRRRGSTRRRSRRGPDPRTARGEEVPQEQRVRALDSGGQAVGVGEPQLDATCQRFEVRRAAIGRSQSTAMTGVGVGGSTDPSYGPV